MTTVSLYVENFSSRKTSKVSVTLFHQLPTFRQLAPSTFWLSMQFYYVKELNPLTLLCYVTEVTRPQGKRLANLHETKFTICNTEISAAAKKVVQHTAVAALAGEQIQDLQRRPDTNIKRLVSFAYEIILDVYNKYMGSDKRYRHSSRQTP